MTRIFRIACLLAAMPLASSYVGAQTISGCGTTTPPKTEVSSVTKLTAGIVCREKAITVAESGIKLRRDAIVKLVPPTPTPAPTPTPTPTPTPVPTVPGVRTFQIGVNVAGSVYYNTERTFANLAYGASEWLDPDAGWGGMASAKLNPYGFPATANGALPINVPQAVWANVETPVTCTWKGAGTLRVDGDRIGETYGDHTLTVRWRAFDRKNSTSRPSMIIYSSGTNLTDPLRDLDCREPGLQTVGAFDKRLVDDLKPFRVLRFLDWSTTNGNPASVTWATRGTALKGGSDGVALEHMIDLANAAGSDAWFTIPWNADEDYVRRASTLIRDRLNGAAYIELSNEVWNFQFGVAGQALNEGIAANLSPDKYTNNLLRLAQKTIWLHSITADVFKATPNRLVRVVSAQNDNPWAGEQIFAFPGLPAAVDAFATAPYFGHSFFDAPNDKTTIADLPALFERLEAQRVTTIERAKGNKRTADRYGKRFVLYEAGQHVISPNGPTAEVAAAMQRDARMGVLYDRYLADLRGVTDLVTIYSATGVISQYGSWGIREYAGQPIAETPKRRAVLDAIAK